MQVLQELANVLLLQESKLGTIGQEHVDLVPSQAFPESIVVVRDVVTRVAS